MTTVSLGASLNVDLWPERPGRMLNLVVTVVASACSFRLCWLLLPGDEAE
jgi:hypothetical protein